MLANQMPVTWQKQPKNNKRQADNQIDSRIDMANLRRLEHDGTAFSKTDWASDTPIETLKADCTASK